MNDSGPDLDLVELVMVVVPGLGFDLVCVSRYGDDEAACAGLEPGRSAVLVVVEDRWAAKLAAAVRTAGGRIVGGGRIAREHAEVPDRPLIDRAAQIAELAGLVERGLLTSEEFERQRRKVFGP